MRITPHLSFLCRMLLIGSVFLSPLSFATADLENLATSNNAVTIQDARGPITFESIPQRVVVLNWDLLEQVIELDITPVGAPNLPGYRDWVVHPAAPSSIVDIGSRAEPNMEQIAILKPDVIIAASPQKDLIDSLSQIAPVVYLPNFDGHKNDAQQAIDNFNTLAVLLGKTALAAKKLTQMEQAFTTLKDKLATAYPELPKVLPIRFSNPTSVFMFTENSTTEYVLNKLGLENPLPKPAAPWGITQQRFQALQHVTDGYVLYILPFPQEEKLKSSVLWKAMPFVRKGHVNAMEPVWSYGGAMSLLYTANAVTDSLLQVAPQ
ncbi:ABC transporter substrate-binding protein [Vibrio sp. 10N.261.51.F12]|uniref:ABC transporter substrate-binding protein n=1 Tax=Vibrio sp. 10N.261.51.F12 TaxID=3229679 RepID=UPI0035506C20